MGTAKPITPPPPASPPKGRAERNARVHASILDAARNLFAAEGVEAVTMRKIAAAIGYTPAALYVHFKDKDDLLRALCRHDFDALTEQTRRVSARVADPVERIRSMGHGYVRFAAEHPNHYRFMFMTPCPVEPAPEDLAIIGNPERDSYAMLVKAVQDAIDARVLRPSYSDAQLVAQTLWAGLHGVVSLQITHGDDPCVALRPLGARAETMIDSMIEGMLADAEKSPSSRTTRRPSGNARQTGRRGRDGRGGTP